MSLQVDSLRYFIAVVESGSIQGASRQLLVSPSALSRQMKMLESEVGTPLLERSSTGISLTESGSIVYAWAKQQSSEQSALLSQLKKVSQGYDLSVKIACAEGCIGSVMSELLQSLTRRFSKFQAEVDVLSSEEVANGVLTGHYDFGLLYGRVMRNGLKAIATRSMPLVAVVPDKQEDSELKYKSYVELQELPWILPNRSFQIRQELDFSFARAGFSPEIALETNSLSLAIRLCSSLNAATFTSQALFDTLKPDGLAAVPLPNSNLMTATLSMIVAEGTGAYLSHILREQVLHGLPHWRIRDAYSTPSVK